MLTHISTCPALQKGACTTERRLVQSNNAFVLTVPDENQHKPASLIAACCLVCCPFGYLCRVCVCVRVCV